MKKDTSERDCGNTAVKTMDPSALSLGQFPRHRFNTSTEVHDTTQPRRGTKVEEGTIVQPASPPIFPDVYPWLGPPEHPQLPPWSARCSGPHARMMERRNLDGEHPQRPGPPDQPPPTGVRGSRSPQAEPGGVAGLCDVDQRHPRGELREPQPHDVGAADPALRCSKRRSPVRHRQPRDVL
ncbi:cAMP-binding protein 1-like isoform X2 [Leucoraja erinacea]|uniref:cAMP-binding protein 1-like isoform X2 n=1 Tax=Leucoraja erinaceus TaxID=7782 RepID=UPI00245465EF|nr:cAMP-binding protein 1-like isoform X2 [Leucoraja erinacea]